MKPVWVAYDHVVHYQVDLDNNEIIAVEIPGWMNTFESPGSIWTEDGDIDPLTDEQQDAMIEVLETEPMPEPNWG